MIFMLSDSDIFDLAVQAGLLNYVDNETPRRYFIAHWAELDDVVTFANSLIERIENVNRNDRNQTP